MHKFSKQITYRNRSDKLFIASYTIVSIQGKVASSRLTFTKRNDELDPVFLMSNMRNNMGISEVKRYEKDNYAGDRIFGRSIFLSFGRMQLNMSLLIQS